MFGGIFLKAALGLFAQSRARKAAAAQAAATRAENDRLAAVAKDAPRSNIVSQFEGIREAAEKSGFNPLTVAQYGNPAGAGLAGSLGVGPSAPPLTSNELLMSSINDLADIASGETARRNSANDLELDLARIKIDQLRSGGGLLARPPAFNSPNGGSNAPNSSTDAFRLSYNPSNVFSPRDPSRLGTYFHDDRRPDQVSPTISDGGISIIDNPAAGPSFPVPTFNGELLDIWQIPVIAGSYVVDRTWRAGEWLGTTAFRLQNGLPVKRPSASQLPRSRPPTP